MNDHHALVLRPCDGVVEQAPLYICTASNGHRPEYDYAVELPVLGLMDCEAGPSGLPVRTVRAKERMSAAKLLADPSCWECDLSSESASGPHPVDEWTREMDLLGCDLRSGQDPVAVVECEQLRPGLQLVTCRCFPRNGEWPEALAVLLEGLLRKPGKGVAHKRR